MTIVVPDSEPLVILLPAHRNPPAQLGSTSKRYRVWGLPQGADLKLSSVIADGVETPQLWSLHRVVRGGEMYVVVSFDADAFAIGIRNELTDEEAGRRLKAAAIDVFERLKKAAQESYTCQRSLRAAFEEARVALQGPHERLLRAVLSGGHVVVTAEVDGCRGPDQRNKRVSFLVHLIQEVAGGEEMEQCG